MDLQVRKKLNKFLHFFIIFLKLCMQINRAAFLPFTYARIDKGAGQNSGDIH